MIIALKTAGDPTEMYLLNDDEVVASKVWDAGRTLARDLLSEIDQLTNSFSNLSGIIVFQGPGSFTGLRIGIATANALADALAIPIVGVSGDDWRQEGLKKLADQQNDKIVLPHYGAEPHITKPKK
jgi:tRNA threonylcarbamoyladenosine biosynthesis protein TsaB